MVSNRKAQRQSKNTRRALSIVPEVGEQVVSLTTQERVIVNNLLPLQGNLIVMRAVQKLREALLFTEEELAERDITVTDNPDGSVSYRWDTEQGKVESELAISGRMFTYLGDRLKAMDRAIPGELQVDHLSLWDKFVPKSEQD